MANTLLPHVLSLHLLKISFTRLMKDNGVLGWHMDTYLEVRRVGQVLCTVSSHCPGRTWRLRETEQSKLFRFRFFSSIPHLMKFLPGPKKIRSSKSEVLQFPALANSSFALLASGTLGINGLYPEAFATQFTAASSLSVLRVGLEYPACSIGGCLR